MEFDSAGGLRLTDLDDFIQPSQACIKPVKTNNKMNRENKVVVKKKKDGSYVQCADDGTEEILTKVEINLGDCLACSGCITSAESVLVSEQNWSNIYKSLIDRKSHDKVSVVSISPQTRAAFAAKYDCSVHKASRILAGFFKMLGCNYVFDTTFAQHISSNAVAAEFKERWINKGPFPLITSSCPGWVCYAEKVHGSFIIPYMSRVKSAQQIMGSLIKDYFFKDVDCSPENIFHLAIMPCHDKKLEASRPDFYNSSFQGRYVDAVVTSGEVEKMMNAANVTFATCAEQNYDCPFLGVDVNGNWVTQDGSGSGGYLKFALEKFKSGLPEDGSSVIRTNPIRKEDLCEVILEQSSIEPIKFLYAYGFRNVQNTIQKIKRNKCPYHFIEIMACPSGCLNGNGQLKTGDVSEPLLPRTKEKYFTLPFDSVNTALANFDDKLEIHTQYHPVEASMSNFKW